MPATRSLRRDVILRVPKIDVKARRPSTASQMGEAEDRERANGSGSIILRRSTSPSKRSGLHNEIVQIEPAKSKTDGKEYKYAAQATSTAEWNSLLIWARRQRGPQWDAATGLWQVDQFSSEYYSFGNDPARNTKLSTAAPHDNVNIKAIDEPRRLSNDEGDVDTDPGRNIHGYGVEDSPPIGPGGRRSRAR